MILKVAKSRGQQWFDSSRFNYVQGSSCIILMGKPVGKDVSCETYGGVTLRWIPGHSIWY